MKNRILYQDEFIRLDEKEQSKYNLVQSELTYGYPGKEFLLRDEKAAERLQEMSSGIYRDAMGNARCFHKKKILKLYKVANRLKGNILILYSCTNEVKLIRTYFPEAKILSTVSDYKLWNSGRVEIGLLKPEPGSMCKLYPGGNQLICFSIPGDLSLYLKVLAHMSVPNGVLFVRHLIVQDTWEEVLYQRVKGKNWRE